VHLETEKPYQLIQAALPKEMNLRKIKLNKNSKVPWKNWRSNMKVARAHFKK